jgi:hypothetical protein
MSQQPPTVARGAVWQISRLFCGRATEARVPGNAFAYQQDLGVCT